MAGRTGRVTLIHNDKAGDARHCRGELVARPERAGYRVTYIAYKSCDLAAALDCPAELVAIAGGDGTVAKVAAHTRADGPPLAILPLGTANNIAKSLGLNLPLDELVMGWSAQRLRPFHLISATGPWGHRRLAEGLGLGAIEAGIAAMPQDPSFVTARRVLRDAVIGAPTERMELRLGEETLDQPFALEVSTVPLLGPNLPLAPMADPSQRRFAISFIGDSPDARDALARWLTAIDSGAPAPVAMRVADRLTLFGRFRRVRLDGHLWDRPPRCDPGAAPDGHETIALASEAEPLRFLAPA